MTKRSRRASQRRAGGTPTPSAAARHAAIDRAIARALRAPRLTSDQIGKVCEELVWEAATYGSDGAIVFYPPKVDNEGTDSLCKRRYRPAIVAIQVKGRVSQRPSGAFEVSVDASTLPRADPKVLVVVHLPDEGPRGKVTAWFIRSAQFKRLASFSAGEYQALFSPSPKSRDRWVAFRRDIRDTAEVLGGFVDEEERRRARPRRTRRTPPKGR